MCVGIPMLVVSVGPYRALCEADGERRELDTLLIDGALSPGDHVLAHGERAIRRLGAAEAAAIGSALRAVLFAVEGCGFEHLIADLIDREPPLPPHLRAEVDAQKARP
jgi:hydrogenase expression/formation protein HypC